MTLFCTVTVPKCDVESDRSILFSFSQIFLIIKGPVIYNVEFCFYIAFYMMKIKLPSGNKIYYIKEVNDWAQKIIYSLQANANIVFCSL